MSDNTILNPGAGGDIARTLERSPGSGIKTQVVVLDLGAGSAEALASGAVPISGSVTVSGGATAANQATEIAALGQLHSDLIAPLPAGTAIIGRVGIDQTTPGTTNRVSLGTDSVAVTGTFYPATQAVTGTFFQATQPVSLATLPALTTGAAVIGAVTQSGTWNTTGTDTVTGNVPAGAADSGNGVKISGVFNTTPPTLTSGWRGDLQVNATGSLIITGQGTQFNGSTGDSINPTSAYGTITTQSFGRVYNGASWDRARGDVNGQVNQPHAMTGSRWQYAGPTGGIVNSATAVVITAAAGAAVRNYLTGLQVASDALGVATEVVILDGATVIWRGKLQTAATAGWSVTFPVPLKGTANTSMSVQTVTATVTGGVYVSAQGFTGT